MNESHVRFEDFIASDERKNVCVEAKVLDEDAMHNGYGFLMHVHDSSVIKVSILFADGKNEENPRECSRNKIELLLFLSCSRYEAF